MKTIITFILFLFSLFCHAQRKDFKEFQQYFKPVALPFVIDSCSIQDIVEVEYEYPDIRDKVKNYVPPELYLELKKEQSIRAFFNIPISRKYISLVVFAGSLEEDDNPIWFTNSVLYLLNYTKSGKLIDYVKIAGYIYEAGHSWCSIMDNVIMYNAFELYREPITFDYPVYEVIPMIEVKYKYDISPDGHFTKNELFYRKGLYDLTYNGCYFEFKSEFPE